MSKNSKFAESNDNTGEDLENAAIDTATSAQGEQAVDPKPQTEAGLKISAAQKGIPKKRIIVVTQVGDAEPVAHASLCAAVVAHGLSKEIDWFTARNALKSSDSWETQGKVWSEPVEGQERTVISEYAVTFKLVDAAWKHESHKAELETA